MPLYRLPYALGAIALGIIGVVVGDFALQWQPVPDGVPAHEALAYASAAMLLACGAGLLLPRTARVAAITIAVFYALWVILLHVPKVIAQPTAVHLWLGVAEIGLLAIGGAFAHALLAGQRASTWTRALQVAAGLCAIVFGLSHFVYADFTAKMVPAWLPAPLFWAYLTGVGHAAAGLSFVANVATRWSAPLFAAMLACFVVLLHVPRIVAAPSSRMEWTMGMVALSLTGAAVLVAVGIARRAGSARR